MPKEGLRDKLEGNELDLSLSDLTTVPVKELALLPKATHLDLSCNQITVLPDNFCSLVHLVKIDLSKNALTELPDNIGALQRLQHLDLLGNQLTTLPVGIGYLKNLKWLDVKDNPLKEQLRVVAGDCLDEFQCRKCATNMVAYMKRVQSEMERQKQKKLQEERELAAAKKAEEEKEKQRRKAEKLAEKERKRREYELSKTQKMVIQDKGDTDEIKDTGEEPSDEKMLDSAQTREGISYCGLFLAVLMVLVGVAVGVVFFCQSNTDIPQCTEGRKIVTDLYVQTEEWIRKYTSK